MTLKFHSNLLNDFLSMLTGSKYHDIIIQAGENQNTKEFRAHSNILKVRSTYFESALSADWAKKKSNNLMEYKKPNITPTVFGLILKYIYTGEVDLTKQSSADIFELLTASDELLFDELFRGVQAYIIMNQTNWIKNNFAHVLHKVYNLPNCKKLLDHCVEIFCTDPRKNFSSIDKDILYDLIQRDDFLIEEVIIWDLLIKWGIEQTPGLNENDDRTKWVDKDYQALKKTLGKYISLIRFSGMSSKDFFDKVLPFKPILPDGIYDGAIEFYLKGTITKAILPPRFGNVKIESNIIRPNLAYMISNWIDNKDAKAIRNKNDIQYTFKLLYRKSRDGLNKITFNNMCKDHSPCLTLIRRDPKKTSYMWRNNSRSNWGPPPPVLDWNSIPVAPPVSSDDWHFNPGWNPDEDSGNSSNTSQQQSNWDITPTNNLKIYGEYNRINATENFIFSFENDKDFENMKISRANHPHPNGPFTDCGSFCLSNCFYVEGPNVYTRKSSIICDNNVIEPDETAFIPEEIEVFKVIKCTDFGVVDNMLVVDQEKKKDFEFARSIFRKRT